MPHSSASLAYTFGFGLLLVSQLSLYLVQHYQSVLAHITRAEPVPSASFLPGGMWQVPPAQS